MPDLFATTPPHYVQEVAMRDLQDFLQSRMCDFISRSSLYFIFVISYYLCRICFFSEIGLNADAEPAVGNAAAIPAGAPITWTPALQQQLAVLDREALAVQLQSIYPLLQSCFYVVLIRARFL